MQKLAFAPYSREFTAIKKHGVVQRGETFSQEQLFDFAQKNHTQIKEYLEVHKLSLAASVYAVFINIVVATCIIGILVVGMALIDSILITVFLGILICVILYYERHKIKALGVLLDVIKTTDKKIKIWEVSAPEEHTEEYIKALLVCASPGWTELQKREWEKLGITTTFRWNAEFEKDRIA